VNDQADPITPDQRRRNRVLGLLLGALSLVLMVTFMIIFSRNGLPKDPAEWNRQQLKQATSQQADSDRGAR
jgi:uncharacterized membrane protein required for colicin V production